MKYAVTVTDVHGEWHMPESDGVPNEGPNPADVFTQVIGWCRTNNVMPETITVMSPSKAEREERGL